MIELLNIRAWALEASFFERVAPVVMQSMAAGKSVPSYILTDQESRHQQQMAEVASTGITARYDDNLDTYVYQMEDGKRIARVPLIGTLTKGGQLSSRGSKELAAMINAINADTNIDAILMVVDGPGGSVSGTTELGLAVSQSDKPTVAYVEEMAASAHYWVASQADMIVANMNEYTQVGSIGVLSILVNESEYLIKNGIEVKVMRGQHSTDKALLNGLEAWPEGALEQYQQELNDINNDFIATVKSGRGDRLKSTTENIFSGKMYRADDALALGMIDYTGNLAGALSVASALSKRNQNL